MRALGLALLALPLAFSPAATAHAADPARPQSPPCHDYKALVDALGARYGEAPVSLGMQNNGNVLQIFASPESGSWTVLTVTPGGVGCIVAAGQHWQSGKAPSRDPAA